MRSSLVIPAILLFVCTAVGQSESGQDELDRVLAAAGSNRGELDRALRESGLRRPAMRHLILGMPGADARMLKADRLLETLRLADIARAQAKWGKAIDEPLFLDHVIPYANVDEPRHPWRKEFRKRFWPLVKDCESAGVAAKILNAKVFPLLGVRYSTKRKRANQSPAESIEQGLASCTGLSIILANACRACGIPARLAGVRNWKKKRGNHTWVEVWSDGWHHIGAAEPSELNRVWFSADVTHALPGSENYGVWATTWRRTPHRFPMAWSKKPAEVHAVETTARYLPENARPEKRNLVRLSIRVRSGANGELVAMPVRAVRVGSEEVMIGRSRSESADTNDILAFELSRSCVWRIHVGEGDRLTVKTWRAGNADDEVLDVVLPAP